MIGSWGPNRVESLNIVTIEELVKDRREEILRIAARHGAAQCAGFSVGRPR